MRTLLLFLLLTLTALAQTPQLPQPGSYEHYIQFLSNRLLGVSNSQEYWLWDLPSRRLLAHQQGGGRILDRACSPDQRYLVITDYPSLARVYSLPGFQLLYTYQPSHPNPQGSYEVHFSSDGRSMLLLGSAHGPVNCDPFVRQVDLASGREIRSYNFGNKRSNRSSLLTGKGMLMARGASTKLQLWDLKTGRKIREISVTDPVSWLGSSRDGIVCATLKHQAVYSWSDLDKLRDIPDRPPGGEATPQSPDGRLSWKTDEDHFTVTRNADQKVIYKGPFTHSLEHWLSHGFQIYPYQPENHVDPVYDFDGQKIGTLPRIMLGYPEHRLVTDQPGYGGPITFYDYQTLKAIGHLPFGTSPRYSSDGKILAVLTRKGVLLIDIQASLQKSKLVPLP